MTSTLLILVLQRFWHSFRCAVVYVRVSCHVQNCTFSVVSVQPERHARATPDCKHFFFCHMFPLYIQPEKQATTCLCYRMDRQNVENLQLGSEFQQRHFWLDFDPRAVVHADRGIIMIVPVTTACAFGQPP